MVKRMFALNIILNDTPRSADSLEISRTLLSIANSLNEGFDLPYPIHNEHNQLIGVANIINPKDYLPPPSQD